MAKPSIGGTETRLISVAGIAALCLVAGFLVLAIIPKDDPRVSAVRQLVFDLTSPMLELAGRPAQAVEDIGNYFTTLGDVRNRNRELERQNIELRERINELTRAEFLMQQYRGLLNLPSEPDLQMVNARVIADLNSPFVHTLVTKGGRDRGIAPGQAAMGPNGLIGRVISSGSNSSRILLLTDFNSHIPVVALSSDVQAILSGTNRPQPELQFLPRQAELKDGDLLVTSGRGGQIPVGLPVALVRRNEDGKLTVQLLDDLQGLNYVRLVLSQATKAPPSELQLAPDISQ
ncbi:MAG: rod shape-determining protein MreC [Rhodobiaceae bacterium]|nr:rod shape-determining protein MreC [Rhodobiaceae bacterium]